jgi:hypothetical protein
MLQPQASVAPVVSDAYFRTVPSRAAVTQLPTLTSLS